VAPRPDQSPDPKARLWNILNEYLEYFHQARALR
jgi:hypothetical protein